MPVVAVVACALAAAFDDVVVAYDGVAAAA